MDRKTLLTTLLIGGGTDAGTAIAQLQHAVSVLDETKADKTGTVALANNLTPYSADSGATQSVPFNNQGTGTGNGESIVDTGSYSQVKKKLGNTVCVNQLVDSDTTEVTIPSGRKYWARINGTDVGGTSDGTAVAVTGGTDKFCDLSLWFGSNDRIPAHLLSHPEDFGRYYSGSLAANPGQLVDTDGSVLTSIGRNVWDEEWEVGGSDGQGGKGTALNAIISKNYRPAIPNQAYYFYCAGYTNAYYLSVMWYDVNKTYLGRQWCCGTTATAPSNAAFFKIYTNSGSYIYGGTYNNDITVSLYYPGESGYDQHYPYSVLAEVDTGSEVLRSAGSVADEKTPDGTITRRIGVVDLGTLNYTKQIDNVYYCSIPDMRESSITGIITTLPYERKQSIYTNWTNYDKVYGTRSQNDRIYFKDTAYADAAAFKTAMSGVYLYYELATPTTEQGTPFSGASADNFAIDDFGSMYWTQSAGVPQGVEIFYPYDYKAAVDTLLNMVDGDVEELVTETELGAVADRIPEAPAEDGTYTLKATVADGVKTYAWVADA